MAKMRRLVGRGGVLSLLLLSSWGLGACAEVERPAPSVASAVKPGIVGACNDASLAIAKARLAEISGRFEVGLTAITDVEEAKAFLWRQRLCMGEVTRQDFCGAGVEAQKAALEGAIAANNVGMRSELDVQHQILVVAEAEEFCAK